MKQLQYLSIQGKQAPSYWFRNHDAQNFRALTESITLSQALIVSSIYRTDLFFSSNNEQDMLDVLKAWHACKNMSHVNQHLEKFIRAHTRSEALEFYFDTLFHLMHQPAHLARYKARFTEVAQLEPQNRILQDLMACDLHLSKQYKKDDLSHVSLTGQPQASPSLASYESFGLLADKSLSEMIYN